MQAGQVSVWVPIVVGLLGVVGVIAGQFVSAWREDQRWKRELKREDIRWERDMLKSHEQHRLDNDQKIRALRLDTYSEFLVVMAKIESNLMSNIGTPAAAQEELQRLHSQNLDLVDNAAQLLAKIQMISTGEVVHGATLLKESVDHKTYHLMSMKRNVHGVVDQEDACDRVFGEFNRNHDRFIKAAQVELESTQTRVTYLQTESSHDPLGDPMGSPRSGCSPTTPEDRPTRDQA